jgi:large subunit ribosomal protein L14e
MIQAGSICKKLAGKEAGRYCVVVSLDEKGRFAQVSGVAKYGMCKSGRCNTKHLKATQFKISLKSAKQEDIERSISESGVITRMGLKKDKRLKYIKVVKCWNKSSKAKKERPVEKKVEKKEKVEAKPTKAEVKKPESKKAPTEKPAKAAKPAKAEKKK